MWIVFKLTHSADVLPKATSQGQTIFASSSLDRCDGKMWKESSKDGTCTFTLLDVVKDEKDDSMKLWSHNMTEFVLKAGCWRYVVFEVCN